MDVEAAEQKMNSMEHSEQHYFKRFVFTTRGLDTVTRNTDEGPLATITMVRNRNLFARLELPSRPPFGLD